MMLYQLKLKVFGKVQGVGYRSYVLGVTSQLPEVTGFVQNEPDGTVGVLLEGQKGVLQDALLRIKQGPRSATVNNVEEEWRPIPQRQYLSFQ